MQEPTRSLPEALGPYRVTGELGRGQMGAVLSGVAPDGRAVAIKLLTAARLLARFEREERLLRELAAEGGFVPLLARGDSPWGPYLVMPLLEGGTLRQRMKRGPLDLAEASALLEPIAAAIGRAHQRGVVHRDLKPSNVLLDREGRPWVADLGLGKHLDGDSGSAVISRTGEWRGTWGYAAPEQVSDAKSVGPPADVFALGAILHECLAGRPAFAGGAPLEVAEAVGKGRFEPLERIRPDLPRQVCALVRRALDPDPARRPADGVAFQRELLAATAPRAPLRLGPAAIGAAILLAGGAAALLIASSRGARPPVPPPPSPTPPAVEPTPAPPGVRVLETRGELRPGKQGAAVTGVAVSRDGATWASCGLDGSIASWDPADGSARWIVPGHPGAATDLAFASDALLVSVGLDGLRAWDARSGAPRFARPREGGLFSVAVGMGQIVTGGASEVLGWEPGRTEPAWSLKLEETGRVSALALAPTQNLLVFVVGDRIHITRPQKAGIRMSSSLEGPEVLQLVFAPGEVLLGGVDTSGALRVWEIPRGVIQLKEVGRYPITRSRDGRAAGAQALAWLSNEEAVVGDEQGLLHRFHLKSRETTITLGGHTAGIEDLARVPGSPRVLSASIDRTARAWDLVGNAELWQPRLGHHGEVERVAWVGDRVVSGGRDGSVRAWRPGQPGEDQFDVGAAIRGLASTADGQVVIAAGRQLRGWNLELPTWREDLEAEVEWVGAREGAIVVAAGGGLFALDGPGRRRALLERGAEGARELSADGRALLCHDRQGPRLVAVPGGRPLVLGGPEVLAACLAGPRVALGRRDGALLLQGLEGGAALELGRGEPAQALASDREGRLLASGHTRAVRVWDLERRVELGACELPDRPVSLAFTPGGERLVVGTVRGLVLVLSTR